MISLMFYYLIRFMTNLKDFLLLLMVYQVNLRALIFPFIMAECGPTFAFYIEKFLNLYTFILKHLIFDVRIINYSFIDYMTVIRFLNDNYCMQPSIFRSIISCSIFWVNNSTLRYLKYGLIFRKAW